ncbi:MAG: InlB B-repeat-containing protein [Bacteroidales bacterium]|nr:InlB B-repeat-containing protein [Bacteroidales bacterium]
MFSKNANFEDMPLTTNAAKLKLGNAGGATGTLHIWDDNKDAGSNLWIKFTPDGYGLAWGTGEWNADDYLPFISADGVTYTTAMVALTAEQLADWSYYVGYKTANSYVYSTTNSETKNLKTIGVYANNDWWSGNIGGFFTAGQRGVFRMWADNADKKNWQCHFVPYYGLCYNANYPAGVSETAPADTWSDFVSVEESRTLSLAAAPVAPAGYIFKGWTTAQDGTGDLLNPGDNYALNNPTANTTLYAQWAKVYNVVYDLDDATGVVPTETSKTEGATFALASADGITKEGFNFAGWSDGEKTYQAGEAYTMPAHDVIFTALWEGPCFVMTKNAKKDKIAAEESDITAWFDIRGGTGAKVMFHPSGERTPTATELPFGNDKDVMVVTLPEGSLFTAGTVLKVILKSGGDDRGLSFDGVEITGLRVSDLITLEYTLPKNYKDSKSIKLKRAGGTVSIRSLEVNGCGIECLDPVPALSVDNAVLCSADNVTFTATNYALNARLELYRAGATEADPATLLKTIESATGESVTFEPIAVDATSSYYVVATAGCERPSEPVTVTLAKQPTAVTISDVPTEAAIGETYTFKATLDDGEGTNFQWYRNGNPIDGATAATYEFTPQKEDELQNIEFSCKFIGCGGAEVASDPATTKVVLNSCYYITRNETLGQGIGYDFGDFVLYTDGNKDSKYQPSTSNICSPANYRYYTTGITVYLKNYGAAALRLQGQQEYNVNIDKAEIADALDDTYIPLTADDYTAVNYTSSSCGQLGIKNVQIPKGKYVHITFSGGSNGEFRISGLCVEGLKCRIPALAWSLSELTCGINETPELPTLTNDDNLPVDYSSSDKTVATIDATTGEVTVIGMGTTTISAVFDGNDTYCEARASYVLTVTCGDDVPQIAPKEGSVSCMAVELRLLQSDGTTPVSSGKVQWYRDGVAIEGATGYTYTAKTAGEYTATLEQTCTVTTSNKAVIASTVTSPDIKAFSPFRTYQITRREVDGVPVRPYSADTHYPLFTLKPTVPDDGTKLCRFTLVVRNGNNVRYTISTPTDNDELDWIRRDFIRDGTIHIGANYPKLGEWIRNYNKSHTDNPFVVGDTIWLTAHPLNACGEYDMDVTATIPIKLTDKFSIAYIITGPDGGSFYEVTEGNLDAFYQNFRDESDYEITPVNAYAPYDYYYYEPYDLVILTDYPKATGDNAKPKRVNALADLVDKKPILSFKAHMAAKELDKWKALGFVGSPEVPSTGQVTMEVLCFSHEIFVEDEGNSIWDKGSDHLITLLSATVTDDKKEKGLQGFSELSVDGFVNIATINGGPNGSKLITCCERQTNVEARMMVLSIFSGAIKNMTQAGMNAVDKILEYLLWTDPVRVSDCAVVFDNGGAEQRTGSGDNLWSNPANWQGNTLPTRLQNVRIEADCEVSGADLQVVSNVCINDKYKLTITPDGKLGSLGKFSMYTNDDQTQISDITSPDIITIQADDKGTGALLHTHAVRPLLATVQLYSKAHIEMVDGKKKNYWAYVGIPVQEAPVPQFFNGAYTWQYDEKDPKAWIRYGNGTTMTAFKGYGLSQPAPQLFTLTGQLAYAQDRVVTLTRTESAGKGQNLIGNSWTAPIQITLLEATDFGEGLQQTVYIYNTGRDAEYGVGGYGGVNDDTPGQWRTIPIETAKLADYAGPKTIPAMQAFEVDFVKDATQKNANLTLKYNRVVRTSKGTDLNMPLYAPRRKAQAVTDEPELMRICVEDSRTRTELYLLQDGRFTDDFDNGWDGFYMEGNGPAAGLWAFTPVGDMAVSAQPAIDGTTLGFRPGRENLYTFSFQWEGEVLYLNDMLLRQSVQIRTGNTYAFTAFDNEAENRFVISHEPCSEVNTSLADIVLTGDLLTLNNPAGELLDVLVYDPAGRICTTRQTADNLVKLDLPATQGVYMVCVRTTDGNKVYKVVR